MIARRLLHVLAALALVAVFSVHGVITSHQLLRPTHADEAEHLHVTWLMSRGQHFYRDFLEDHSPLLEVALLPLVPHETAPMYPVLDLPSYLRSARLLMAFFGALAVGCVGLAAWRATRRASAPVVVAALLLGCYWTWRLGTSDVRNDPPALALFFAGLVLLSWRFEHTTSSAVRAGVGGGLVAVSFLVNPKWPMATLLVGVIYFVDVVRFGRAARRRALLALGTGAAPILLALATIAYLSSLRDFWFFTFALNLRVFAWYRSSAFIRSFFHVPFEYSADPFKRALPLAGTLVLAAALLVPRARAAWQGDRRVATCALLLIVASYLDVRLTPSYPNLLAQYYMMWSFAGALLYGCLPEAVLTLGRAAWAFAARLSPLVEVGAIAGAVFGFVHSSSWRLVRPQAPAFWAGMSYIQRELKPGDRVWIDSRAHPIVVEDASYYWYAFADFVPASLKSVAAHRADGHLPPAREQDLPLCRAARREDDHLRFVSEEKMFVELPHTRDCFRSLAQSGRLAPTPMPGVFKIRP